MDKLRELADRVNNLDADFTRLVQSYLEDENICGSSLLLNLLKGQLFRGKGASGDNLHPLYSEDLQSSGGFFKTPETARRYAMHKRNSTPYPSGWDDAHNEREDDAPNLYINGRFHSELIVIFGSGTINFTGATPYSLNIINKYGNRMFGLTDENWNTLLRNVIIPEILKYIRNE